MKPGIKASLLIGSIVIAMSAVIYATTQFIILKGFTDLEADTVKLNTRRVIDALHDDLVTLDSETADWATWDDSYAFIKDGNPQFIEKNIPDDTFSRLRINLILYIDLTGRMVYGKYFDFDKAGEAPIPQGLDDYLRAHPDLLRYPNPHPTYGIVMLPSGPLLVGIRPILTSEGVGPAGGALIMGRMLDATEIRRLADMTHLTLFMYNLRTPALPDDIERALAALRKRGSIAMEIPDQVHVHGYALLHDIESQPALVLRVEMPRDIYIRGSNAIDYFLLTLLVIALVSVTSLMLLIGKLLSSLQKNREVEQRYQSVVRQSGEGIILVDAQDGHLLDANAAFCRLLGYRAEEVMGLLLKDLLNCNEDAVKRYLNQILSESRHVTSEEQYRRKDGAWLDVEIGAYVVFHAGKNVVCIMVRDITERKFAEQRIKYLAQYDALTNLPNRTLLRDRLQQELAHADRNRWLVAVVFLDLDRFKVINDSLGHYIGDLLLQAIAQRLIGAVRNGDSVSRQGGDEFVIVISQIKDNEDVTGIADKLLHVVSRAYDIQGQEITISTSIGISLYPRDGTDIETLMKHADLAMYQAKAVGGNEYRTFSSDMDVGVRERLDLENNLRHALDLEQLYLVYQPQVRLASGRVCGMEALLRWRHPDLGEILPVKFIPLAEETGLILSIGEWVLRRACSQLNAWRRQGFDDLTISVNLSARQLLQKDLVRRISSVLEETGLPAALLDLELTESMLMDNMRDNIAMLRSLREVGIAISIDDFGTGYSSLAYLHSLPIETLKIDRSFVRAIASRDGDAPIAKAVIALAHSLKLKVIAEGVETEEQLEFLLRHGCDIIQGYYFSKPLTADDFIELLRSGRQLPARAVPPLQSVR